MLEEAINLKDIHWLRDRRYHQVRGPEKHAESRI